jgi:adenylate kinase
MEERIIREEEIHAAITKIAAQLNLKYTEVQTPVLMLIIMDGAMRFASDLISQCHFPMRIESIKHKTYSNKGNMHVCEDSTFLHRENPENEVIVIDDIYDSGTTMYSIQSLVHRSLPTANIQSCTLLVREGNEQEVDFSGLTLEKNLWAIGYGLDDTIGLNRNLNHIILTQKDA